MLIDMALRGQSNTPVRPLDLGGVEFVVPDKSGIDDVQPEVGANLETTMKRLAAAGAKVTSRPIPQIAAMRALSAQYGSFVAIEAYAEHRAIFDSADAQRMDRRVVKRALGGRVTERDALNLQRGREELIAALTDELKGAVLVLPATPMTAPAIDPLERDDELFRVTNLRTIHYTFLGNLFRMCGLALPSGTDAAGLPTGVQFLAPGGDDDRLLSIGLSMEKALSAPREASLSLIRHAPDRAAAVVADEQRTVRRDRDADRATPDALVVADEADQKILILAGRLAVLHHQPHDFVAGALGPVPRAVQRDEGVALVVGGKLIRAIERDGERRGMRLNENVGRRDVAREIRPLVLVARVLMVAEIVPGPAIEGALRDMRRIVGRQIVAEVRRVR